MPVPDAKVEMQIGGVWTDTTNDALMEEGVSHTRGRTRPGARVDAAKMAYGLLNPDLKYSPRHPMSANYGLIGRNTRTRLSVAGPVHLAMTGTAGFSTGASTPDAAALDIVGDIDIRFDATLTNWLASGSVELCGKGTPTGNQRSWLLLMRDRRLHFEWSTAGTSTISTDSTAEVVVPPSDRLAVRVTLDVDNGAAGNTCRFYTGPSISGPWTQLGADVVTAGVTSIFNSTAPLRVGQGWDALGFPSADGQVHAFELRSGIAGSVVANPDFTVQTAGAASFTDSTGKVWTIGLATSLSDRHYRCVTEIPVWKPRWHVSGNKVTARIESSGIMRRLGQGRKALASTLRRRIPSFSPLAYWPMEDQNGATRAASALTGGSPLYTLGLDFGSDDSLPGSKALPVVSTGGRLNGRVPAPAAGVTEWQTEFVFFLATGPGAESMALGYWSTGTVKKWHLSFNDATSARIQGFGADGLSVVDTIVGPTTSLYGQWNRWQLYATQNGGNVDWNALWIGVGGSAGATSGSYAGTVGRITDVVGPPAAYAAGADGLRLGHIAVFADIDTAYYNFADHGFSGESAGTRLRRLSGEESIPVVIHETAGAIPELLGAQRPDTALSLMGEAADSESGILSEDHRTVALAYRDRWSLYNQTPKLVVPYAKLGPPLEPVDDDLTTRNDNEVGRAGGSSSRVVQETGPMSVEAPEDGGVGIYDESVTLSLAADEQTFQQAAWRTHLGTWDASRFERVRIMLHKHPELITEVLAIREGDVIQITDGPDFLEPGPFNLMVQGFEEELKEFAWEITFYCSPADPWTVGVVGDTILGRPDTDASELASGVDADDLSFSVAVTAGPLWITSAAFPTHFPLNAMIGGERVSVSAISGGASPQTFTISARSVNGIVKAHSAGAALSLADPMRPAL
ncbi:hypothetical protein [Streptomyces sp. V1I1]|uniref:hypothetical protein n=1 Tax=Streptomyces sp. V1I1 TaxID=3042272 RepID=UPI0027867D5E|nr:hypothetical protein [Streptomyces sp. V1I1]MDQ0943265.1 hypothetical protein [Streptomyces sp. V1I1]